MNILLIIEGTYPWYRGGVSEWVYRYIKNRPDFNFTILQIATDEFFSLNPSQALYPIPENVNKFVRVSPPEGLQKWAETSKEWLNSIMPEVENSVLNNAIIHVTNTGFAGWLGVQIAKKYSKPLVLTEHAIYWLEIKKGAVALECGYKIPDTDKDKQLVVDIFQDIAVLVYKEADALVTVSKCNIPFQKQLGAAHSQYIPNGIPHEWLSKKLERHNIPVIGWVGRCAEMKNPLQFFEFVDEFRKIEFKTEYIMLLSDANEKKLEQQIKNKSIHYPEVKLIWNEASESYYPKMDMLLITSHNESQPLVMFEALAKGVLPIGRKVGDLTEEFGYVFEPDTTVKYIVEQIIALWKDETSFNEYVDERYTVIEKVHTWKKIFEDYKQLFTSL